jgi:hypothetical protein
LSLSFSFLTNTLYAPLHSLIHATCPTSFHFSFYDTTKFGENYKLWSSIRNGYTVDNIPWNVISLLKDCVGRWFVQCQYLRPKYSRNHNHFLCDISL